MKPNRVFNSSNVLLPSILTAAVSHAGCAADSEQQPSNSLEHSGSVVDCYYAGSPDAELLTPNTAVRVDKDQARVKFAATLDSTKSHAACPADSSDNLDVYVALSESQANYAGYVWRNAAHVRLLAEEVAPLETRLTNDTFLGLAAHLRVELGTGTIKTITFDVDAPERDALMAFYEANPVLSWDVSSPDYTTWNPNDIRVNEDNSVRALIIWNSPEKTTLPPQVSELKNLEELSVYDGVVSVPAEVGNLPKLQTLRLPNSDFTELPAEVGNLSELQSLVLSGGNLTSLPSSIINLENVGQIYLEDNAFTTVPKELYGMNLRVVVIGNPGMSIPNDIGNLSSVETFELHEVSVTSIPEKLLDMPSLDRLVFDNVPLTDLSVLKNAPQIETLALRGTQLSTIPVDDLNENLAGLGMFDHPTLTEVPNGIGNLKNLGYLQIENSPLATISSELYTLPSVYQIVMANTELTSIAPEIGSMASLQFLFVTHNQLTTLPKELADVESLLFVNLEGNPLESLPAEICEAQVVFGVDTNALCSNAP